MIDDLVELLKQRHAQNIVIIDIGKVSPTIANYFIVASGYTSDHLEAIVQSIEELYEPMHVEGRGSKWVVVDYFEIVVHLMTPDYREYYDLEGLWMHAPQRKVEQE